MKMEEPTRLMNGSGPARELLRGSTLRVPSGAKQRALQFAGAAVGLTASGTAAAAGSLSLAKSLLLTISLSAVGGGIASLAVSEAFNRSEVARTAAAPAPRPPVETGPRRLPVAASPTSEVERDLPQDAAARLSPEPTTPSPAPGLSRGKTSAVDSPAAPSSIVVPGAPRSGSLFEEQSIIEAARAALSRGDARHALATLDGYNRQYAQGQFGPEALALRVEALRAEGQLGLARTLAHDFERRYPHHPLLTRVKGALE